MRLKAWLKREKTSIAELARAVGLPYKTVHEHVHEKHPATRRVARLLSAATGGAVSVDELEDRVAKPTPKRKRRAVAERFRPAAHG